MVSARFNIGQWNHGETQTIRVQATKCEYEEHLNQYLFKKMHVIIS